MSQAKPLDIQKDLIQNTPVKIILEKCFFGRNSVLKLQLSKQVIKYSCYIHIGIIEKNDKWNWIKSKFNEIELAQIINFINSKEEKISFFHKFNNQSKSIHLSKTQKGIIMKIDQFTKLISYPESKVLEILLTKIIEIKNFKTY